MLLTLSLEVGRGLPARPSRQASASMEMPSSARVVRLSQTHRRPDEELGVRPNKPAKHSDMSHVSSRTGTFYEHKWPSALRQKPSELAEAGFFYTGTIKSNQCHFNFRPCTSEQDKTKLMIFLFSHCLGLVDSLLWLCHGWFYTYV